MDLSPLLIGVIGALVGLAVGALIAFLVASGRARAAEAAAAAAQRAEAAARATSEMHVAQTAEARAQAEAERQRAEREAEGRAAAQQELRVAEERLAEREKALAAQAALVEQSKVALTDAFKATGADVLNSAAATLLKQAREQFDSHKQLSQQDLEARQQAIDATLAPLREQIQRSEQLLREMNEKREGDSKTLGEQLKQIADLQQKASTAAHTLSTALRDNRQRGRWGEHSLKNIAELAGLSGHVDFSEQTEVQGDEGERLRPDMTVRLPGGRFVPIDAKVPMSAYLDSLDVTLSDNERQQRRAAHAQALRTHVRALVSRDYARALGGGVEITVLFVPLESGLHAALEEDPSVFQEALEKRVIIATGSTLLAVLRTCALQWQQATLNENARLIGDSAKELLGRITKFAEHLDNMGSNLENAVKHYNSAVRSYNTRLLPSARDTAELAGEIAAPQEIDTIALTTQDTPTKRLPTAD
jgi:DNA recombination protein RmuC